MGWTMLYLFVFLKLPILAACYIVWWAVHQEDKPGDEASGGGGGQRRPHPRKPFPRLPRRGPHGEAALASPPRIRRPRFRTRRRQRQL